MPTIQERLTQIEPKVERAKKHISDVESAIRVFLNTKPYKVGTKRNPDTRQLIYYLAAIQPVPDPIVPIVADAIQNMVSALDHLAYQIVCAGTNDNPPNPKRIYFPIALDASGYIAKRDRVIQGTRQTAFKAIDTLNPYKGGNDLLWALQELNNLDKHRLLVMLGSRNRSMNFGAEITAQTRKIIPNFPDIKIYFRHSSPNDVALKQGDELYISAPDAEVYEDMDFRFEVALSEPQIIELKPIIELLHQFADTVEGIISKLTPELA